MTKLRTGGGFEGARCPCAVMRGDARRKPFLLLGFAEFAGRSRRLVSLSRYGLNDLMRNLFGAELAGCRIRCYRNPWKLVVRSLTDHISPIRLRTGSVPPVSRLNPFTRLSGN
jgi:hypothetical protein